MAEKPRQEKEVLGIRLVRRERSVREFDLKGTLTVGGRRTNSTVIYGDDPHASVVNFKETSDASAVLLFDDNAAGRITTQDGEISLNTLRSSGVLVKENGRWAFRIQKGVTGTVETDGLTFEFGYRPASVKKPVIIPKTGPAFERKAAIFAGDEDAVRFRKSFAVTFSVGLAFFIWSQVAAPLEHEFRVEDIVKRVTKLEVPEFVIEGVGEAETDVVAGGGGGGGGASGGGGDGATMPSTGIIAAITTIGPGSGRSIADILGGGSGIGSDLDTIASGIGGLKGAGAGDSLGGGLGLGSGDGTGIGGSGDGIAGLAGGGGGLGGGGTKLVKKNVSVTGSAPSSISGAGTGGGGRSAADISGVIRRHLAGIQNAYISELKKNPNLGGGKMVVSFTISADGSVTSASLISSTMGAPGLESRVVSMIYGWRFPTGATGEVTVIYPLVFITTE